jgi:hypothetical protein
MYALTVIALGVVFMTLSLGVYRVLAGQEQIAASLPAKGSKAV